MAFLPHRFLLLVLACAVVVCPPASSAARGSTLYVAQTNPRCSDAAGGTSNQPFCTIGAAARNVIPGQTVRVAAGDYQERVVLHTHGTSHAPVAFVAQSGASVSLRGGRNGFYLSNASWVTISGFAITDTSSYGISVTNASNITLVRNRVSRSGKESPGALAAGIYLNSVSNSLVWSNVSSGNSYAGILLTYGATRNVVKANTTYGNRSGYDRRAPGIRLYNAPNNTVTGNISFGNEDSGIELYSGSGKVLVSNNLAYMNGDHGIDVFRSPGARVLANSVHRNATAGINVEAGSSQTLIENNIAVDNGVDSLRSKGNIRVDLDSAEGTRMDFDLVYLTSAGLSVNPSYLVVWGATGAATLKDLTAATGQEAHGIQADPRWARPVSTSQLASRSPDYHLTSRSPAIDSADSGGSGQPVRDRDGHKRVDDRRVPNTGAGRHPYFDRGAFEFIRGKVAKTSAG